VPGGRSSTAVAAAGIHAPEQQAEASQGHGSAQRDAVADGRRGGERDGEGERDVRRIDHGGRGHLLLVGRVRGGGVAADFPPGRRERRGRGERHRERARARDAGDGAGRTPRCRWRWPGGRR